MNDSEICKQLELYSNAIVAFVVIQSLTFCYNFGTNGNFNNVLRAHKGLSSILTIDVFIVMLLALYANHFLGTKLKQLSEKHQETITTIYRGKAVAIVIFSALQIGVTVFYAIFGQFPNVMP